MSRKKINRDRDLSNDFLLLFFFINSTLTEEDACVMLTRQGVPFAIKKPILIWSTLLALLSRAIPTK